VSFAVTLLLLVGGLIGGFYGSVVGSAGLVSVSILTLLGLPPVQAIATSRPAGVVLEFVSALRYRREGILNTQNIRVSLLLGLCSAAGALVLLTYTPNAVTQLLMAIAMVTLGLAGVDPLWSKRFATGKHSWAIECLGVFALGIYGGFFAFIYGTFLTLFLVWQNRTFVQSAAQSRVIGCMMSISAAVFFMWKGTIHYQYTLPLAIGFGLGAWAGVGVGVRHGEKYIKQVLRVVVVLAVYKLLYDFYISV
jgi:uncharacterized protein